VGVGKRAARKRAVGTREHVIGYLGETGELFDPGGMASTRLAAAVGYPGSSVAFAQLLSGMERSGLIERDVRGKRTYRIGLGQGADPAHAGMVIPGRRAAGTAAAVGASGAIGVGEVVEAAWPSGAAGVTGATGAAGTAGTAGATGFDYDELARRLLVQVVRRLAAAEPKPGHPDPSALQETVSGLEYELATAWTKHGKLAEENVRLREQLRAARRSMALAAERVRGLPADLDSYEVGLLRRLLTEDGADQAGETAADTEEARSLAEAPGA
jgi:hypothetical protein